MLVKMNEAGLSDSEERESLLEGGEMASIYVHQWSMSESDFGGRSSAESVKSAVFC